MEKNILTKNPKGPLKGKYKVIRGGAWINYAVGKLPADRTDAKAWHAIKLCWFSLRKIVYSVFQISGTPEARPVCLKLEVSILAVSRSHA